MAKAPATQRVQFGNGNVFMLSPGEAAEAMASDPKAKVIDRKRATGGSAAEKQLGDTAAKASEAEAATLREENEALRAQLAAAQSKAEQPPQEPAETVAKTK